MDTDRGDRWSRALAAPDRLTPSGPPPSRLVDALARMLGVGASRRSVLGTLLAVLLAPRIPLAEAAARQEDVCRSSECPCPCPDPPCFLRAWGRGDPGQFLHPYGVAVAPDGTVYVADWGNHRIQAFDATGSYLGQWGSQGSGEGEFDRPSGVAMAPDGTVYVVDAYNDRVQAFCVPPGAGTPRISGPTATPVGAGS